MEIDEKLIQVPAPYLSVTWVNSVYNSLSSTNNAQVHNLQIIWVLSSFMRILKVFIDHNDHIWAKIPNMVSKQSLEVTENDETKFCRSTARGTWAGML